LLTAVQFGVLASYSHNHHSDLIPLASRTWTASFLPPPPILRPRGPTFGFGGKTLPTAQFSVPASYGHIHHPPTIQLASPTYPTSYSLPPPILSTGGSIFGFGVKSACPCSIWHSHVVRSHPPSPTYPASYSLPPLILSTGGSIFGFGDQNPRTILISGSLPPPLPPLHTLHPTLTSHTPHLLHLTYK
jgi:hypothetical protein